MNFERISQLKFPKQITNTRKWIQQIESTKSLCWVLFYWNFPKQKVSMKLISDPNHQKTNVRVGYIVFVFAQFMFSMLLHVHIELLRRRLGMGSYWPKKNNFSCLVVLYIIYYNLCTNKIYTDILEIGYVLPLWNNHWQMESSVF